MRTLFQTIGICAAFLVSSASTFGDFSFTFDKTSATVGLGGSVGFDIFVSENSTNFFAKNITGFSLSIANSNAGVAAFSSFTQNPVFSVGSANVSANSVDMIFNSFPNPGVGGTNRLLGTVFLTGNASSGSTNIQVAAHPTANISELSFGFTDNVDFASPGVSASFQTATITAVPEPSSMVLLGLLSVPAVAYRRWKKART